MENKHEHWASIVDTFFADTGVLILSLLDSKTGGSKEFPIVKPAVSRFFYTAFNSVEGLHISVNGAKTESLGGNTRVTCERARFTWIYDSESTNRCPMEVSLSADMSFHSQLIVSSARMERQADCLLVKLAKNGVDEIRGGEPRAFRPACCA